MPHTSTPILKNPIPYSASFTREQFLFYEMRVTARLKWEGLSDEEVIGRVTKENLFQYPTEKSVGRMVWACIRRLKAMGDETLVGAFAEGPFQTAKQICLYAMMRQYRIVWEFMVIGEKYRLRDTSFGKMDPRLIVFQTHERCWTY